VALGIAPDSHWLALFCAASEEALPDFNPQNLSNTVWALGRLQHAPPPSWAAAFLGALRTKMGAFSAVQLSDTLYGLSQLGLRPEQGLLARLLVACAGSVNVMGGAPPPRHPATPPGGSGAACVPCWRLGRAAPARTPVPGCAGLWSPARLHPPPPRAYPPAPCPPPPSPRAGAELASLVAACVQFEHQPTELWLRLMVAEAGAGLELTPPSSAALLLQSLAQLRHDPGAAWLADFCATMGARADECSPAEMLQVGACLPARPPALPACLAAA
jgi:hypothetical protein